MTESDVSHHRKVSEEEQLIGTVLRRVSLNDHAAFQQIYELTATRFMSLLMKILLNEKDEAEEVLQEAFVKIWQKANTFRDGSPMAWMTVIVRNTALDFIRSKKRKIDTLSDEKFEAVDLIQISNIESWSIQKCLEQLDIGTRDVILQSYYYGFSHSELAQLFEAPLGTIKTQIRNGLKRLSSCLQ